MRKSLALFGLEMVYDEAIMAVLVKDRGRVIDFHHASNRRDAKRVMARIENDFHSIASAMEV